MKFGKKGNSVFKIDGNNKGHTGYPARNLLSGYPACFSGIRLSDRILGDIRPDSRIITKIKLILRVAKHILENKI